VAPEVDGHLFAFSRVARTGLPVHINAFFEVRDSVVGFRSDGRDASLEAHRAPPVAPVARASEDQASYEWNRELFVCVVEAYMDLLTALPQVFEADPSVM
jgi:hypothetical protein